jgi:hypothetical protein
MRMPSEVSSKLWLWRRMSSRRKRKKRSRKI